MSRLRLWAALLAAVFSLAAVVMVWVGWQAQRDLTDRPEEVLEALK